MKNPYVLACFLLLPTALLGLTLQEDDLVFDDVGEETTSTAATVIRTNWYEQKYPHETRRHQGASFDKERVHVVVPVGHVLKLKVHKEAFSGPEDYYEVREIPSAISQKFLANYKQCFNASCLRIVVCLTEKRPDKKIC